jgi:hypothetical protein
VTEMKESLHLGPWYRPLINALWTHFEKNHNKHPEAFELYEERDMMEEWLMYEKFEEGGLESMSCPFVGCKWHQDFTINYTLLTKGE